MSFLTPMDRLYVGVFKNKGYRIVKLSEGKFIGGPIHVGEVAPEFEVWVDSEEFIEEEL